MQIGLYEAQEPTIQPATMNTATGFRLGQLPSIVTRGVRNVSTAAPRTPSKGFQGPEGHGEKIWVFSHRRSEQVIYSFRDTLDVGRSDVTVSKPSLTYYNRAFKTSSSYLLTARRPSQRNYARITGHPSPLSLFLRARAASAATSFRSYAS